MRPLDAKVLKLWWVDIVLASVYSVLLEGLFPVQYSNNFSNWVKYWIQENTVVKVFQLRNI